MNLKWNVDLMFDFLTDHDVFRSIHVVSFLLSPSRIPVCLSIPQLKNNGMVSTSEYATIFIFKSLCKYMLSFLLYVGVELLDHIPNVCLTLLDITILFSKMALPLCIPTSNV